MYEIPTENAQEENLLIEFDQSDRYRILADEQRRIVLTVLAAHRTTLTLAELATAIDARVADDENTTTADRIALHHKHLPIMDDADVIDYDPSTKRVDPSLGA